MQQEDAQIIFSKAAHWTQGHHYGRSLDNEGVDCNVEWLSRQEGWYRETKIYLKHHNETWIQLDATVKRRDAIEMIADETKKATATMVIEVTISTVKDVMAVLAEVWCPSEKWGLNCRYST